MSVWGIIDEVRAALFGWTLTSNSSAKGNNDQVETADQAPEGSQQKTQRPVKRLEPFGVRSRPPNNLRSFTIRIGTSNVVSVGYSVGGKYGPGDLDVGETALYCVINDVVVKLDKNGKITITAAADQNVDITGQIVNVNGSDHPLPKWDTFEAQLAECLTGILGGVDGTSGQFPPSVVESLTNVAAALGDGTFDSTKANNG